MADGGAQEAEATVTEGEDIVTLGSKPSEGNGRSGDAPAVARPSPSWARSIGCDANAVGMVGDLNERDGVKSNDDRGDDSDRDEEAQFEEDTDSFLLRRRTFDFPGLPSALTLHQDFVTVDGTGGAVWRSSIAFALFVCSPEGPRHVALAGKSILEISSGLGLGAIVAWHLGSSPVVATDIDFDGGPMALLRKNITATCCGGVRGTISHDYNERGEYFDSQGSRGVLNRDGGNKADRSPPLVQELRWGDSGQLGDALSVFGGFGPDVVLACDVVFDEAFLPALMETLVEACTPCTEAGGRPCLCISHQRRNRKLEKLFFAELGKRLRGREGNGTGAWREVHRIGDISVFVMAWEEGLEGL